MPTRLVMVLAALLVSGAAAAQPDAAALAALATGDTLAKLEAIDRLASTGRADADRILEALEKGELFTTAEGRLALLRGAGLFDASTGERLGASPEEVEQVSINNRIRRALASARATLALTSPDRDVRLAAAESMESRADGALRAVLERALSLERDDEVAQVLRFSLARLELTREDSPQTRLEAARLLGESARPGTRAALAARLESTPDGGWVEPEASVRTELQRSITRIDRRMAFGELLGQLFSGLSLGSILLLAALGLAITYGLLGVINMAHGEMLMAGAYATYVVQGLVQHAAPSLSEYYLLFALPVSFLVAAALGAALEWALIRHLYGRPLETLLATWGISLILIQATRTLFGAQNVQVASPSWMSGGWRLWTGQVLPYNRILIIAFSLLVLGATWLVLSRTRLGLFIRAVTQHRTMAGCVGVATERVDLLAFALGSGIAGLGGCALSQIGNVGPDLGQSYVIDSFMVVVLGGVGQLAGTILAAFGLGGASKLLEPFSGAVLAKIAILVFIIIFIQRRPQGLFALKGRNTEG